MEGRGRRKAFGAGRRSLRWVLGLVSVAAMVLLVAYFDRQARSAVPAESPASRESDRQAGVAARRSEEPWATGSFQGPGSPDPARTFRERENDEDDHDDDHRDGWEWDDDDEEWESLLRRLLIASPSGDVRPLRSRAS